MHCRARVGCLPTERTSPAAQTRYQACRVALIQRRTGARAMTRLSRLIAVVLLSTGGSPALGQAIDHEIIAYSVQSVCVDEAGRPSPELPISDSCSRARPQRSNDVATYRKHDWPNDLSAPDTVLGYQASDSVIQRGVSRTLVVQTLDFGTAGRVFGRFDEGRGDGGQLLVAVDGWASFVMTEDGTGGVQWFVGEGCKRSGNDDTRFAGWLVFRSQPRTDPWVSKVARLNITADPRVCPNVFNNAFTRYRFDRVEFPFRIINSVARVTDLRKPLEVVVSEHYGGASIRAADHLERFFMAKGLGLVRWERWANGNLEQPSSVRDSAEKLATTARCPRIDGYAMPARNWLLVDCRTWTTLVRQKAAWMVDDYRWPALRRFN